MERLGRYASIIFCCLTILSAGAYAQFGMQPGGRAPFASSNFRFARHPFPRSLIYTNPGLSAPALGYANAGPNQMIDFFYASYGVDPFSISSTGYPQFAGVSPGRGLSPSSAFATPQGCYNFITQYYYFNGVEPNCRGINTGGGAGTTFTGAVQVTGGPEGFQIEGGGQILFTGTCGIAGSPNNNQTGYVNGMTDIVLQTNPAVPGTLFSVINGGFIVVQCLTASADQYTFDAQQFSNIFINSAVNVIRGPGGSTDDILVAQNQGQIYVSGLTVATGASGAFALAQTLSSINFLSSTTATFDAGISGTTLTVNQSSIGNCSAGNPYTCIGVGDVIQALSGSGVIQGTYVTAASAGSCSGGSCVYTISQSQTVSSGTGMSSTYPAVTFVNQPNTGALPLFADTFAAQVNAAFIIGTANAFAGGTNAGSGPKCSIILNSTMQAQGQASSLPGGTGSACAAGLGGVVN